MSETIPGAAPDRKVGITITAWGTRGSTPVSGPEFSRYGGNTTCIEVRCGKAVLIFDAGTGIIPAGRSLFAEGITDIKLFFTHSHYDHLQGLPFFAPLHKPQFSVSICSGHTEGVLSTEDIIKGVMRPPCFPVGPDVFKAKISYGDFMPGDVMEPVPGVVIRTGRLRHPGGAVGFRIEYAGRIACIITDTEHVPGEIDGNVVDLIAGADLFLYDGAYCDEDMRKYHGFGHSSWQQALRLAEVSGAASVGIIHHSFMHTDDELDRIEVMARREFANAHLVKDGQVFELAGR